MWIIVIFDVMNCMNLLDIVFNYNYLFAIPVPFDIIIIIFYLDLV